MDGSAERILAAVDRLAPALERANLDEVEVSVGDLEIRLARRRPEASAASPLPAAPAAVPAAAPPASVPDERTSAFGQPAPGMRVVSAPLTGVWYPSPSPGARPYVNEGDEIAAGQVVGLIEAMKLFNEIKSDVSGIVTRVLVDNGTLVKRKQALLEIDPR